MGLVGLKISLGYSPSIVLIGHAAKLNSNQKQEIKIEKTDTGLALFFLNFTCPCARNIKSLLRSEIQSLKSLGYKVVVLNTDRSSVKSNVEKLFKMADLGADVLDDSMWELVKKFKIKTAAEWVLLNKRGEKLFKGAIYSEDIDYISEVVKDLKLNIPLRYTIGRGLGCSLIDPENMDSVPWVIE